MLSVGSNNIAAFAKAAARAFGLQTNQNVLRKQGLPHLRAAFSSQPIQGPFHTLGVRHASLLTEASLFPPQAISKLGIRAISSPPTQRDDLDCRLRDIMDGLETLKRLQRLHPPEGSCLRSPIMTTLCLNLESLKTPEETNALKASGIPAWLEKHATGISSSGVNFKALVSPAKNSPYIDFRYTSVVEILDKHNLPIPVFMKQQPPQTKHSDASTEGLVPWGNGGGAD
jgi:hypothetical protein